MYILGIDLGLTTGWAVLSSDNISDTQYKIRQVVKSGSICLGKQVDGESLCELIHLIDDLIMTYLPSFVVYEGVKQFHKSRAAARAFGCYEGVLLPLCFHYDIKVIEVGVSEVKKAITGNGRSDKLAVENAVYKKYDVVVDDNNESDAIAIAHTGTYKIKD